MKHLWLFSKGDKWIHSPKRQEVYAMNVNQLMVEGEKRWHTNKIQEFFIYFYFYFFYGRCYLAGPYVSISAM
jgi:hypothetical protein